jgi:hypothetical protein
MIKYQKTLFKYISIGQHFYFDDIEYIKITPTVRSAYKHTYFSNAKLAPTENDPTLPLPFYNFNENDVVAFDLSIL